MFTNNPSILLTTNSTGFLASILENTDHILNERKIWSFPSIKLEVSEMRDSPSDGSDSCA